MDVNLPAWLSQLGTIEYWQALLAAFEGLGPLPPILMAMLESFFPALPLVGIVAVNVAAHGPVWGFLYSWAGTCLGCTVTFLFWRRVLAGAAVRLAQKHEKLAQARAWVDGMRPASLFVILIMPFTPSSFVNFAFGAAAYDGRRYLTTLAAAKLVMIGLLAAFGQSIALAMHNPLYLALSVGLLAVLYLASKKVSDRFGL